MGCLSKFTSSTGLYKCHMRTVFPSTLSNYGILSSFNNLKSCTWEQRRRLFETSASSLASQTHTSTEAAEQRTKCNNAQCFLPNRFTRLIKAQAFLCSCHITGCPGALASEFTDVLLAYGAQAAWIQDRTPSEASKDGAVDAQTYKQVYPGEGPAWLAAVWFDCQITALFGASMQQEDMLAIVSQGARAAGVRAPLQMTWADVYTQDWEAVVHASYKPLELQNNLWIIPDWWWAFHGGLIPWERSEQEEQVSVCAHRCDEVDESAVNIRLHPGVAFGTGEHPTTQMCIAWLQEHIRPGDAVIDYGCGSGILAISACKYGARQAVAVDVDPVAVRVTERNASLNGYEHECECLACGPDANDPDPLECLDGYAPTTFDVCFANILQPALLDLRTRFLSYLRPGGHLVLSGMLHNQVQAVKEAYSPDIIEWCLQLDGEWARLSGTKR